MKQLLLICAVVACGKKEDGNTGVVLPVVEDSNPPSTEPSATDDPEPVTEVEFEQTKVKAEAGDAEGQFNLGNQYNAPMYQAVEQDFEEATKWYRKAAEQGQLRGQLYLGSMYAEGKGVEQDFKEALKWYRKAAEQGDAGGQEVLQSFLKEHPELREE